MKLIDRGNISCRVEVIVWSFVELDQMYDRVADEKEWVENKFGQGKNAALLECRSCRFHT